MNSSAFEKVLLSAILTSCTVFSVSMVAFIPRRPQPITVEPPDRIESTEQINQRDVVIRHIGMSIVISVGTGITTAELLRKWGRSREASLSGQQGFSAQAMLQAVAPNLAPDLALAGDGFTTSLKSMTEADHWSVEQQELHQQAVAVMAPDRADGLEQPELPLFLFQPSAVPLQSEDVNWFQPFLPDVAPLDSVPDSPLETIDEQSTASRLLSSREQYQTCRIASPNASERVLAILFDEQYYRFVKLTSDRTQALRIAQRVDQRGEATVITAMGDRYAIWSLEPEAHPAAIDSEMALSTLMA
ncbi:MAG: hypothetical protein KME45_00635 [Stenomitos rutilans HA7619-LM2]|jgi:hypothetical protein|nr:hypothetical protein [Stenomitos rutilans HA7619-LM2]